MDCMLIFMKRTPKEIEIFGGEVYIDIDGRNIGKLGLNNLKINIEDGVHKVKMYKSHTYGTFIGIAESEINVINGEKLLVKYASPMLVNQPGNIIVSDYISEDYIETMVESKDNIIRQEYDNKQKKIDKQEQKNRNGITIFVVIMIGIAIFWGIYMASITNSVNGY